MPSFKSFRSGVFVFIVLTYTPAHPPTHPHTHTHRDKVIAIHSPPYHVCADNQVIFVDRSVPRRAIPGPRIRVFVIMLGNSWLGGRNVIQPVKTTVGMQLVVSDWSCVHCRLLSPLRPSSHADILLPAYPGCPGNQWRRQMRTAGEAKSDGLEHGSLPAGSRGRAAAGLKGEDSEADAFLSLQKFAT